MENTQYRKTLFCLITTLFWFSLYAYVPILANYLKETHATDQMIGLIIGSYGFTQMILRIPLGILSDRLQKRKLFIILGLFFTVISGAGLFLANDNHYLILLFRGLSGVAASSWVTFTILYASYYHKDHTTNAIGTINFFNSAGQMLALLLGAFVTQIFSWSASFLLSTIVGMIGLLLSFFIIENVEKNEQKITIPGLFSAIKNHNLIIASLFAIVSQMITFATAFSFTTIHAKAIGATTFELGVLSFASTLPSALASLIGGKYLGNKYGEKRIIFFGFILMGIFTISIPFTNSFLTLVLTQFLSGVGRGFSFPMLMSLSIKDIDSSKKATAMGFFQAVYGIGMTIGPILMGFLSEHFSLAQGFITFGYLSFISAVLFYFLSHKNKRPSLDDLSKV